MRYEVGSRRYEVGKENAPRVGERFRILVLVFIPDLDSIYYLLYTCLFLLTAFPTSYL